MARCRECGNTIRAGNTTAPPPAPARTPRQASPQPRADDFGLDDILAMADDASSDETGNSQVTQLRPPQGPRQPSAPVTPAAPARPQPPRPDTATPATPCTTEPAQQSDSTTPPRQDDTSSGLDSETSVPGDSNVLRVECRCGRRFRVKKNRAGQKVRCPSCEEPVVIPAIEQPAPAKTATERKLPTFAELAALIRREEQKQSFNGNGNGNSNGKAKQPGPSRKLRKLIRQLGQRPGELTHQQELNRRDILIELGQCEDPLACETLLPELHDPSPVLRKAAITALGELGCPLAAAPLVEQLADSEPDVLRAIIRSLQQIGGPRVVRPLVVLGLASPHVKYLVTDAVTKIDEQAVPVLLDLLQHRDPGLVLEAIVLLGRLRTKKAVRCLIQVTEARGPLFRSHAAEAMGHIGDPRCLPTLQRLLDDEDPGVRLNAVTAIGRIPDANSVKPLIPRLNDEDIEIRLATVTALASIGDRRAADPLAQLLQQPDDRLRLAVARALGDLNDSRATGTLLEFIDRGELELQLEALSGLRKLKDPRATSRLLSLLDESEARLRERAVDLLGDCGDTDTAERLEQVLRMDRSEDVRAAAARALGEIGDPVSVDVLTDALNDQFSIRCRAIVSLGQIGDDAAQPALLAMLKDQTPEVRFHACNAIAQARLKSARNPLEPLLYDSVTMVQRAAARALVKLDDPRGDALLDEKQLAKWQGKPPGNTGTMATMTSISWKDRLTDLIPDNLAGAGLENILQNRLVLGGGLAGLLVILGGIGLWSLAGPAGPPVLQGYVVSVSFSPDGKKLAVGRSRGILQYWDVASGKLDESDESRAGTEFRGVSYGGTGDVLLLAWGRKVAFEGDTSRVREGHTAPITATIRTPDRKLTATMSSDGVIILWDMTSRTPRGAIQIPAESAALIAITADGSQIAGADKAGLITIWDSSNGETVSTFTAAAEVHALAFSPDGQQLALALSDARLEVRLTGDAETPPRYITCPEEQSASLLRFLPDNRQLVTQFRSTLYLTDITADEPQFEQLIGLDKPVQALDISADGRLLAVSGQQERRVLLYNLAAKKSSHVLEVLGLGRGR